MSKIAIIAALEREVGPLIKDWQVRQIENAGRSYRSFENGDLVLVCGGIGGEAARRTAEAVIAVHRPQMIYSAGFAGALEKSLHVGEIIVPRRVVDSGDGSTVDTGDGTGILISFGSIASPEQKARLARAFNAQAVDMEASSVARAAQAHGIPFAAVKAISDESDFIFPSLERFVSPNGKFRTPQFALFAIIRPWLWGSLFRLSRNSARAAEALAGWLERLAGTRNTRSQFRQSVETIHQR